MARKYHPVERKIHPITIIAILGVILTIILTIVLLDDNPNKKLYSRYTDAYYTHYVEWNANSQQGTEPVYKPTAFDEKNKFTIVNHFSDNWLGLDKGLSSYIKSSDVTILFLTDLSLLRSFNSVPYVYERFYGSNDKAILNEIIDPSPLYTEGYVKNLIIFEISTSKFDLEKFYDQINEQTGANLSVMNTPLLIAFQNNKVIHTFDPGNNRITPNNARDFYNEVYEMLTTEE